MAGRVTGQPLVWQVDAAKRDAELANCGNSPVMQ
jgi:hypothetical protein